MSNAFTPDASLQQHAQVLAQEAVDYAAKHLQVTLDYSDTSIQRLDSILGDFHQRRFAPDGPSEEEVQQYARTFGSYIGETFRRNHSATWGATPNDGGKMPSMRSDHSTTVFFPWTRAHNRITNGDSDGIAAYYQFLLDELKADSQPVFPPAPSKKSLFGRLFGK